MSNPEQGGTVPEQAPQQVASGLRVSSALFFEKDRGKRNRCTVPHKVKGCLSSNITILPGKAPVDLYVGVCEDNPASSPCSLFITNLSIGPTRNPIRKGFISQEF
jgi:hypothetical protein